MAQVTAAATVLLLADRLWGRGRDGGGRSSQAGTDVLIAIGLCVSPLWSRPEAAIPETIVAGLTAARTPGGEVLGDVSLTVIRG